MLRRWGAELRKSSRLRQQYDFILQKSCLSLQTGGDDDEEIVVDNTVQLAVPHSPIQQVEPRAREGAVGVRSEGLDGQGLSGASAAKGESNCDIAVPDQSIPTSSGSSGGVTGFSQSATSPLSRGEEPGQARHVRGLEGQGEAAGACCPVQGQVKPDLTPSGKKHLWVGGFFRHTTYTIRSSKSCVQDVPLPDRPLELKQYRKSNRGKKEKPRNSDFKN